MKSVQPWYWRSLPLENRTGSEVFAALFLAPGNIATLLESPYPSPPNQPQLARYSICAGVPRILDGRPQLWTPAIGEILPFLRQLFQRGRGTEARDSSLPSLPFTGGWLGWLGYDLAWEIERLPKLKLDPLPFPVAYWYEPECFAVLDHWEQTLSLATTEEAQLDRLQNQLEQKSRDTVGKLTAGSDPSPTPPLQGEGLSGSHPSPTPPLQGEGLSGSPFPRREGGWGVRFSENSISRENSPPSLPHFLTSQADYEDAVRQAKKYIQAGDIFQANLSLRFETRTTADSWSIYRALQQINPSPFASYWQTPWGSVISCSPERLVHLQGRSCQTRPIAGTRSRGATPEQDQQQAQDLLSNTKEIAEHIMLVDLERNDLGRVCEWGSVRVDELLTIERYSHVMHLVSNITGTLQSNCDRVDLIRALFPGGTITGCPKVRCMEIIEELEPLRRNLFYGSCGYLDWWGNLDLNIFIRTLLFTTQDQYSSPLCSTVWGQVGAGIVADSDPEKEWYESLHKAQAQLGALYLAEMPYQKSANLHGD